MDCEFDVIKVALDHLATAVLGFDGELRLQWMNAEAEGLLGSSARQWIGRRLIELWPASSALALAAEEAVAGGPRVALRGLRLAPAPGRAAISVDCTVSPLSEPLMGASLLLEMQLSDRDRELVREAEREARQRLARRMLRNLAHELRNPLAGLRGAAQLLERELDRSELKDYTRIIIGEADRLGRLAADLLGPERAPRFELVNLHRPLEQVRRLFGAEASPAIVIERDYDPSLPPVQVDPDQLTQALLNLLRNAAEALGDQGGCICLRTRVIHNAVIGHRARRLAARISVIDDGPGIPADQIERIFFPTVTGNPARSGLGLSIARTLIDRNGGRIDCRSVPGRTEFQIDLPMAEAGDER